MTFDEVLDQVRALLQERGRVTYRSLKRRFALDDEYVEDLKGEVIYLRQSRRLGNREPLKAVTVTLC